LWIVILAAQIAILVACQTAPNTLEQTTASETTSNELPSLPDPESFADMGDEELLTAIVDIADAQVSSNDEDPYAALIKLPYGYQIIYVTWRVESEVNSGGFYQYFNDTNARFTYLAERAFKQISAPNAAGVLKRAMQQVETTMPELLDPDRNPQQFNEGKIANDPFNKLEQEFFDDNENLAELRVRYIRGHLGQFKTGQIK